MKTNVKKLHMNAKVMFTQTITTLDKVLIDLLIDDMLFLGQQLAV